MESKAILKAVTLLLAAMLILAINLQPAKASGTVYIRADGSIDPSTAPIQRNGDVYTLSNDMYEPIVLEKDELVLDGAGHVLQGTPPMENGIYIWGRRNVEVKNMKIKGFFSNIYVRESTEIVITENEITEGLNVGIRLISSYANEISNNYIARNAAIGLWLSSSLPLTSHNNLIVGNNFEINGEAIESDPWSGPNFIYHNNFIDSIHDQVWLVYSESDPILQVLDNGYPSGGNYWSDYTGVDLYSGPNQNEPRSDGIGDTPYVVWIIHWPFPPKPTLNVDHYPLMQPWSPVPSNRPPLVPSAPQGPNIVDKDSNYEFSSSATDPDGDMVRIVFDWGDGTLDTTAFLNSGSVFRGHHSWSRTGVFEVKAKAVDIHNVESTWSAPLQVTVCLTYQTIWSGYVVDLENSFPVILSIEGEWTQPAFNDVPDWSTQFTWIGIGGASPANSRLLQAGVIVKKLPLFDYSMTLCWQAVDGKKLIDAGYDWVIPGFPSHPVQPGDPIRASITMTGYNQWYVAVTDVATGFTFSDTVNFDPDLTSVEWIHEPDADGSGFACFEPIAFNKALYTMNGVAHQLGKIEPTLNAELKRYEYPPKGNLLTNTSPIEQYQKFTISCLASSSVAADKATILSLYSSADLHVYDSQGNHLGYNYTSGLFDTGIPYSDFLEDENGAQFACLFQDGLYRVDLIGRETGSFHLNVLGLSNDVVTFSRWFNGTAVQGAKYEYRLDVSEQTVAVGPDPIAELKQLRTLLNSLTSNVFDERIMSASKMKKMLSSKLDEVVLKVHVGSYSWAIDKLRNDIRAKMDGDSTARDWIIDPATQFKLCIIIDHITESIRIAQNS